MNCGLVFLGNSSYSFKSSRCNRGYSELLWDVRIDILVRICSSNWKFYHIRHNTHFLSSFLKLIIKIKLYSETYSIKTRQTATLHLPQTNLASNQKGFYYLGIKIFNGLPSDITNFSFNPQKNLNSLKILLTYKFPLFTRWIL